MKQKNLKPQKNLTADKKEHSYSEVLPISMLFVGVLC